MMNVLRWVGASLIIVATIALFILIPTVFFPEPTALGIALLVLTAGAGVPLSITGMITAHREWRVDQARYLWYEDNDELSVGQEIKALKRRRREIKNNIQNSPDERYRMRNLYGELQSVDSKISALKGSKGQKLTRA